MNNDTSYIKDIGLVIWGCKGGYRIFCSNVVDVNEKDISDTLKDIRSFVAVRRHGVDYYAVEFTAAYKVYTHYRSSNDSGAGAFIAITLFVPHSLMITNVREVLDEMLNRYFREYVNPLNGTPLPGKFDEIRPFQNMLDTLARVVPDRRMLRYSPSVQNNIPKVVKYDDPAIVDRYFDNPYHKEFFDCQEVMFFRRDLVDNRAAFDITFNREPEIIEKVSESVPMNRLFPFADEGVEILSLKVNGIDYTGRIDDVGLRHDDRLDIALRRRYFHDGQISGTVDELVKSGFLNRQGVDYRMVTPRMKPVRYYMWVQGKDCDTSLVAPCLRLSSKTEGVVDAVQMDGGWVFPLDGPKVTAEYVVGLFPNRFSNAKFPVGKCRPIEYIEAQRPLEVKAVALIPRIQLPKGASPEIEAEIYADNVTLETRVVEGQPLMVPPTAKMALRADDFKVKPVDGVYVFTPLSEQVGVMIQPAFNRVTTDARVAVRYEGKDYEIRSGVVKLPFGASKGSIELCCKTATGDVLVPMVLMPDGCLTLTGTVVSNRSPHAVQVKIGGNLKKVMPGALVAVGSVADVVFANQPDGDVYKLLCDNLPALRLYTIMPAAATVDDRWAGGTKSPDDVTVQFVNCDKFYINGKQIADDKEYTLSKGENVVIKTSKDNPVEQFKPADKAQTRGEFTMKHVGRNRYVITYIPSLVSRIFEALLSKTGMVIYGVLLAILFGVSGWLLFTKGGKEYAFSVDLTAGAPDTVASVTALDSLDRIMTSSGRTLLFLRTGPVAAVTGKERIVVNYGNEGIDTLCLDEVIKADTLSDLKNFLVSEKPMDLDRAVTLPATPAARFYAELTGRRSPVTDETKAEFVSRYADSRYVDSLQLILDRAEQAKLDEARRKAEADSAYEAVAAPYRQLIDRLKRMDCSMADVNKIEDYQAEHKNVIDKEIAVYAAKVSAYKKFFDPKESPCLHKNLFTPEQKAAAAYYDNYWQIHKKNDPKRDFNYAAGKLKEMGIKK